MKKIIYFFGILFLSIVIILNILFTAYLDASEHITINSNNIFYAIGIILAGILIYLLSKIIEKYLCNDENSKIKKNIKISLIILMITAYIVFCRLWIIIKNPTIVGDQIHAINLAQTFFRGDTEEFLQGMTYAGIPLNEYMQAYHQQISLSFVFSIFFRIINSDSIDSLKVLNVICIALNILAIYKITKQLSKEYKTNKVLMSILLLTFISLPMLSTFVYGDIPSMTLCLFSVYFMMRYTENKKIIYPILASILTMIAYMARMNSLIFIIATVIYLFINLFKEIKNKTIKEKSVEILIILIYIIISILPASIVKNYYLNKYDLDKSKEYPNISYILMAMEEGPRGNGWYNEDIGEQALKEPEKMKEEYAERIKDRLIYFIQNPGYTFKFYIDKITSMWTENTYSAIRNNTIEENDSLENMIEPLTFYQKTLLLITCTCCLIVLIQNRKKLSINVLFLITIFIGGFAFHILWEAKSRYIIPYIIVLIPVATININNKMRRSYKEDKWKIY